MHQSLEKMSVNIIAVVGMYLLCALLCIIGVITSSDIINILLGGVFKYLLIFEDACTL